jgi:hypothetical protein
VHDEVAIKPKSLAMSLGMGHIVDIKIMTAVVNRAKRLRLIIDFQT